MMAPSPTIVAAALLVWLSLGVASVAPAQTAPRSDESETTVDPLETARLYRDRARKLGAKGSTPAAWSAYDKRLDEAKDDTLSAAAIADLEREGRQLLNRATFLAEIKESRGELETLLQRYDRSLRRVAALMDVPWNDEYTGDAAADRLVAALEAHLLESRVTGDSLRVENRRLRELTGGRIAAQDSLITALQVEASALLKKLWETELRAGVAEADRSAAETALTRRQAREQLVREIVADMGDDATSTLGPDGTLTLQVHGLDFAVGSANLAPGQADLMNRIAAAVGRFPGAAVTVEGHTDDTGSRASNVKLSQRRADTVAGGIERRLQLPEGSIRTVGHGPDRPVAPNSTPEGRARNRRIDIVIVPADL
jgi:outer membrane protein OmpA-like peptidoglycan-associated protein